METLNATWDSIKQKWVDDNGVWNFMHHRVVGGIIEHIDTSFSLLAPLVFIYRYGCCCCNERVAFHIDAKLLGDLKIGDKVVATVIPCKNSSFLSCIDIIGVL